MINGGSQSATFMSKSVQKKDKSSESNEPVKYDFGKNIHEVLAEKHACYVLITCDPPNDDGQMQVAMTYEGDPMLAAYLLQGAQSYIDEYDDEDLDFQDETLFAD